MNMAWIAMLPWEIINSNTIHSIPGENGMTPYMIITATNINQSPQHVMSCLKSRSFNHRDPPDPGHEQLSPTVKKMEKGHILRLRC